MSVVLIILDGFGESNSHFGNAILGAHTPFLDYLRNQHPFSILQASGEFVGLFPNEMGNSEAGHLTIGSGRAVLRSAPRIQKSVLDGSLYRNEVLLEHFKKVKVCGSRIHLLGICSDGGVHGHVEYFGLFMKFARLHGIQNIFLHLILDGRDVGGKSAKIYINVVEREARRYGANIVSVLGRFYAMDRDLRWGRVSKAFDVIARGKGLSCNGDVETVLEKAYLEGESDEFLLPRVVEDGFGCQERGIRPDDVVIFLNFRPDRARQLTEALSSKKFLHFSRSSFVPVDMVCMTEYDSKFKLPVIFPKEKVVGSLGEILADEGQRQFRVAETEKYAHITFFLNGEQEKPYPLEDRVLIPSNVNVRTYDQDPCMQTFAIGLEAERCLEEGKHDFIVSNFASPDMVGHTGDYDATMMAVESVDLALKRVVKVAQKSGSSVLICADHGNAESMRYENGEPKKSHTNNPVPLFVLAPKVDRICPMGTLADVAPTVLDLMGISVPHEMTGHSLIL